MTRPDVYLLTAHEPYTAPEHPVPINTLIVHALTLLHPEVPQPDGGMMYRCLTEFPGRRPDEIVPVSTLTFELDGGRLWPEVADWMAVTAALVRLSRAGRCDSMPIGLPEVPSLLLSMGPLTENYLQTPGGATERRGPQHRQAELDQLGVHLRRFLSQGPFWPGDDLVSPPSRWTVMPYLPFGRARRRRLTKSAAPVVRLADDVQQARLTNVCSNGVGHLVDGTGDQVGPGCPG